MMKLLPISQDGRIDLEATALPDVASGVVDATIALYARAGFVPPWICYIAVQDGDCVGTCGFTSPPRSDRVEMAYFTFPAFEGRGVATAMAASLVAMARREDPSVTVFARTLQARNASHRILEKLGFASIGAVETEEDGTVLEWQSDRIGS